MTLVEVTVAVVLALTISLGLLGAHLSARHAMRVSRHAFEASNVLQSYMEQVRATNYVNLADAAVPDVVLSDGGTDAADDNVTGTVQVDVSDNGNDTKTVVATLTWQERFWNQKSERSISLATLVSEP